MEETGITSGLDSPPLEGSSSPSSVAAGPIVPVPASPSFVYALGQIEPRFPTLAVEKEFVQATGRADAAGLTDREALQTILTDRANRYLVRQLCWVFVIQGLETYLLAPRDPADLELLVEAIRPRPSPTDLDVVIGVRGPLASPEACNGLVVPVVAFDQLYSFDRDALLAAIPRPDEVPEKEDKRFRATAAELFDWILQMADNAGATDEHRALNYLAVRYPAIYARTTAAHTDNASLSAVDVRSSRLSGVRKIVDVVFSYTHRRTDVTEKYLVRVDVTEEFPFLVTKLSPYFDR
jgi:PatG C-terminal